MALPSISAPTQNIHLFVNSEMEDDAEAVRQAFLGRYPGANISLTEVGLGPTQQDLYQPFPSPLISYLHVRTQTCYDRAMAILQTSPGASAAYNRLFAISIVTRVLNGEELNKSIVRKPLAPGILYRARVIYVKKILPEGEESGLEEAFSFLSMNTSV